MEAVALKDIVSAAVRDAAGALHDRKADVILPTDLGRLAVDRAILEKALVILLEHAAKQGPTGSTVTIQAARDAKAVRLQVMDEGDGIPPQELDGIFGQFHLLSPGDGRMSGAGLHLAVCGGFVEAIGGVVSAAYRTDRSGAVFTITFPAAA
jgi:two-component system sensor histidine kinase KdpD